MAWMVLGHAYEIPKPEFGSNQKLGSRLLSNLMSFISFILQHSAEERETIESLMTSYAANCCIIKTYFDTTHWTCQLSDGNECPSPRTTITCKTTVKHLKGKRALIRATRSEHLRCTVSLCFSYCFAGCQCNSINSSYPSFALLFCNVILMYEMKTHVIFY